MANCACVVRGLLPLADAELGVSVVVRGWAVKKARDGDGVELVVAGIVLLVGAAGDRRDVKDESREAFCASVDWSALFNLLVSCNCLRSARIDSGVGAVAGSGTVRFCNQSVGFSNRRSVDELEEAKPSNLVMSQAHPGCQIVRHREDISQCVNLKFVKCLVNGCFEQRL